MTVASVGSAGSTTVAESMVMNVPSTMIPAWPQTRAGTERVVAASAITPPYQR